MNSSPYSSEMTFKQNPLFYAAVFFAVGICLQSYVRPHFLIACGFVALLISSFSNKAVIPVLAAAFVLSGYLAGYAEFRPVNNLSIAALIDNGWIRSGDPVEAEGIVVDNPQLSPDGRSFDLNVSRLIYKKETIAADGRIRLYFRFANPRDPECGIDNLKSGNRVLVSVRLKREERFRNPGTRSTIESLDRRGLSAVASLKSCQLLEVISMESSPFSIVSSFRNQILERIISIHSAKPAGIIIASMLGNRSFISAGSGDIYRENGTFHVLVISGLHITFAGLLILLFIRSLTSNRVVQLLAANSLLWLYALFVGLELPVIRAALMYSVFLLSYTLNRGSSLLNSLGFAVLVILAWRPSDLFNPSFQLTFLSIFAIVGFAIPFIGKLRAVGSWTPTSRQPFPPKILKPIRIFSEMIYWNKVSWSMKKRKSIWDCEIEKSSVSARLSGTIYQKILRQLIEVGIVTVSVQLFLLPLLVLNFHRIGYASVISNSFAGIAVAFLNTGAVISLLISLIDLEAARSFASLTDNISAGSELVQAAVSEKLFSAARIPVYTGWLRYIYALYFIPLLALTWILRFWNPFQRSNYASRLGGVMAAVGLIFLALIIVSHPFSEPVRDGRLRVHFLDVGQGDSAFIEFPNGKTLLIDGGGLRRFYSGDESAFQPDRAGIGEKVVSEFLWERGYARVDAVISTHPDADHINGLVDVVKNFDVSVIYAGGDFKGNTEFEALRNAAAARGVPIRVLRGGALLNYGATRLDVLHPRSSGEVGAGNSDSIVVRIIYRKRNFLFTGDIGSSTERHLIQENDNLQSDIVKVPHHGSRTSSSSRFIEAVKAEYAIVPVGIYSPYGHPHRDVIQRWIENGVRVLLVGENGTTTISTDGFDLSVEAFAGQPKTQKPDRFPESKPPERSFVLSN